MRGGRQAGRQAAHVQAVAPHCSIVLIDYELHFNLVDGCEVQLMAVSP